LTDYSKNTNFTAKDALASGNPSKVISGVDFDSEFDEIATCIATKLDLPNSLTEDSSPIGTTDYVATYDASATAYKKVLLNKLGPGRNTVVHIRGNSTQVLAAATVTRLTNLTSEVIDLGGIAASSKITLTSAEQDGSYLCFGRILFDNTAGQKRCGIARFDSGNNIVSSTFDEAEVTTNGRLILNTVNIVQLTFASGDYIGLIGYSEAGETLASSNIHALYAVRIS